MNIITAGASLLTSSTVAGSSYSDWNIATAYTAGQFVFLPSTYGEYECLVDNTGLDPSENLYNASTNPSGEWKFLGTANKYKMFDQFLNTQTQDTASPMVVEFSNYGAMAIFVGNITGDSLTIEVIRNLDSSVLESYTKSLYLEPANWMEYFYGDWLTSNRVKSVLYERTTLSRDVTIRLTLEGSGTIGIGVVLAGQKKEIGATQWGFQVDALDFSTVVTDTSSGATYLSKGNVVKLITADIWCNTNQSEPAYNVLSAVSGTICVFYDTIISGETQKLFGFIKKVSQAYKGYNETLIKVDIQGLI